MMSATNLHFDDACDRASAGLSAFLGPKPAGWRLLLIADVTGRLRAILWCPPDQWESARREVDALMTEMSGPFWSKVLMKATGEGNPDRSWQENAWELAPVLEGNDNRLRFLARHRAKAAWFCAPTEPPWPTGRNRATMALFYSFKGGVGRSTTLAATALRLAAEGQRVAVLDADMDAPGVGSLLSGRDGAVARYGIVDYLLEHSALASLHPPLDDYYHSCFFRHATGDKQIFVFPAGTLDERFIDKLARIDYADPLAESDHAFDVLLRRIQNDLSPDWILIDSRAGLGEASGHLTAGFCHVNVLFGALSEASWKGTGLLLDRLGGDRIRQASPRRQAECIWVAAMVPRQRQQYDNAIDAFRERSRDLFSERYYADPGVDDDLWTTDDLEDIDSPHEPVVIPYDPLLADFRDLDDVADAVLLQPGPYQEFVERLHAVRKRL